MKWTKKQEKLIKQVIDHYKASKEVSIPKRQIWDANYCPFCKHYPHCKGCPNKRINLIFVTNLLKRNIPLPHELETEDNYCEENAFYTDTFGYDNKQIDKRIQFWEDALNLSTRKFVQKWGASKTDIAETITPKDIGG